MKTLYFTAVLTVLFVMLFSCAGGPSGKVSVEPDTAPAEETAAAEETVQLETVWKPAAVVSMYIDGTVDKTVSYRYDDEGRELLSEEFDGQGELQHSYKSQYSDGHLQRREAFDGTALISITLYEVDASGNVTSIMKQDAEGNTLSIINNTYEGSLLKTSTAFDAGGIPSLKLIYTYQDGELLSIEYQLPDGTLDARLERTLENGLPVKEKVVLPDGSVESAREFSYASGVLSGETQYAGTMKLKTAEYEYDDNGNLIKETWSDRSGKAYEVIEHSWISFEIGD